MRHEPRTAAKCNRPILTTKAYHVCRPLGPPRLPLSLPSFSLFLSLFACDEIFIVPEPPDLRDTRSCETVPIHCPTNPSRRGRREQQKFAKARKCCRSSTSWVPAPVERRPRRGPRSSETGEIDSSERPTRRGRDWTMADARKRETRCKIEGNRDTIAYLV